MGERYTCILRIVVRFICAVALGIASRPASGLAAGSCGTGSWTSGTLEIHHINIGQGDSALIVSPDGRSLLFDAGESTWNSSTKAQVIGAYIQGVLGCTSLDYVVVSHFHLDHVGYVGYGGLWHLVETQGFTVGKTLVRDGVTTTGRRSPRPPGRRLPNRRSARPARRRRRCPCPRSPGG